MSPRGAQWTRSGALTIALSSLALLAGAAVRAQDAKATPTTEERLQDIRRDARRNFAATAAALREIDPSTPGGQSLGEEDRLVWLRLARETAVRVGDAAWLAELRDRGHDPFSEVALYRILLAGGHLEEGDLASAHAELEQVDDLEKINERDRRRYWALKARIARLEGDVPAERDAVERIVHELQYWPTKSCQGCHDDSRFPGAAPLLDLEGFWFGQRYAAILQSAGDAARVLSESDAALKAQANDVDALIQRGYALMALGRAADARECFARIEWFAAEGRVGGKPRMMTAYP